MALILSIALQDQTKLRFGYALSKVKTANKCKIIIISTEPQIRSSKCIHVDLGTTCYAGVGVSCQTTEGWYCKSLSLWQCGSTHIATRMLIRVLRSESLKGRGCTHSSPQFECEVVWIEKPHITLGHCTVLLTHTNTGTDLSLD